MNKIIKYVIFGAWNLSLNIMLVRFIYIVAYNYIFLLLCSVYYVNIPQLSILLSINVWVVSFGSITDNGAIIIPVYSFCRAHVTFLLGIYKGAEFLNNRICKCLVYMDTIKEFSKVVNH